MKENIKERIYLLPMGAISASAVKAIKDALSKTFGIEVLLHEEVSLPVSSFNMDRRQYLSFIVIDEIARIGMDGIVLGMADQDLYAQGLNFVFGEADKEKRVAVISIARLRKEFYGGSPDEELLVQRAVKEAVHEIGHVLGLPHCPKADCVMHFSNTISHTDLKSAEPCPSCKKTYETVLRRA